MANKKKQPADTNDNVNGVARLKIKGSTKSPTQERSTPSPLSDEQNFGRLTDSLPRFVLDEYEVNTQVICQYADSYYYDAKIVKKRKLDNEEFLYTIHYNGWNQRYDEEITHAAAQEKFLVYSPENLAIAKRELKEAKSGKRKGSKTNPKKPAKKAKKDDIEDKQSISSQPIVQSERTRTQSSNTRQGSSTSRLEGAAEATNDEADTGDDLLLAPYLAQVPKEKRNNLIFPIGLDKVLNDDSDLVNRQLKLPKIPARYTIDDIFSKFLESQYDPDFPDLEDIRNNIDDLVVFFNKVINLRILYQLEFVQHLALLNKKRRDFGLSDLAADDFLDKEEFNGGLESPMSEEAKEDEDMAFKPPKQIKPDATTEGESDKRQLRETRNKKSTTEQPPLKVVARPKKKEKVEQAGSKNFELDNDFNFADTYGFIHLVRFFYFYNSLLKSDTVANAIYIKYAELINEIIEFLSLNVSTYFKIEEDYEIETPAYQRQAFTHN
jgi:hypothetical protein